MCLYAYVPIASTKYFVKIGTGGSLLEPADQNTYHLRSVWELILIFDSQLLHLVKVESFDIISCIILHPSAFSFKMRHLVYWTLSAERILLSWAEVKCWAASLKQYIYYRINSPQRSKSMLHHPESLICLRNDPIIFYFKNNNFVRKCLKQKSFLRNSTWKTYLIQWKFLIKYSK